MNPFVRKVLKSKGKIRDWKGEGFLHVERKYDGHRVTLLRDLDGTVRAFGRLADRPLPEALEGPLAGVLCGPVAETRFPVGTAIDGEVYVPCGGSQDVRTALLAGTGWQYVAWDVPWLQGRPYVLPGGQAGFAARDRLLASLGLQVPDAFDVQWERGREQDIARRLDDSARELGIEGYVLKASASSGWWRQKPIRTVDCIVLGVKEGQGRLESSLGALIVGVNSTGGIREIANVGTGFDDDTRADLWFRKEELLGLVVEVAYDTVQVDRLRFPRFVQFRDDKTPQECTIAQIESHQV